MGTTATPNLGLIKPDLQEIIKATPGPGWAAQNALNMDAVDNALRINWDTYTPLWESNAIHPTFGLGGSVTGHYMELGKNFISLWIVLDVGGAGFAGGTGQYEVTLPFPGDDSIISESTAGVAIVYDNSSSLNTQLGVPVIEGDRFGLYIDTNAFSWSSTQPFTIGQEDAMVAWLTYARAV